MQVENWPSAGPSARLYQELKQLDLLENIAELDVFGFTIVPPDKVGSPDYHARMRESLLSVVTERFGEPAQDGLSWEEANQIFRLILWENEAFEELLMNPVGLGLVQHLVGTNCILSLFDGWVKGPGEARTPIHCDHWDFSRKTFAPEPMSANFNYLITDYSADDGAISFVPGSHKWHRYPSPAEVKYWSEHAHPVEAKAGSMVIWGDQTWHGSFPRKVNGERLMILGTFSRGYLQTQEPFRDTVSAEALSRNPLRFAGLMDVYGAFPFGKDDVDARRLSENINSSAIDTAPYYSLFDCEPAGDKVSRRPEYEYEVFNKEGWLSARQARVERSMARNRQE